MDPLSSLFSTALGGASAIAGAGEAQQGLSIAQEGGQLQLEGGQFAQQQYNVAGQSVMAGAVYNSQVTAQNLTQTLDAMGRDIRSTTSQQAGQAAATGLSVSSGSFLSDQNSLLTNFSRQMYNATNQARQKEQATLFEGASEQVGFENQGIASLFQGQVSDWNTQAQAIQAQQQAQDQAGMSIASSIGGLFTSLL